MEKNELEDFLTEFREIIRKDGGDFQILEVKDNYLKLKIKGRKNRVRSRNNLYAVINIALKNKFKGEKYIFDMENWKVDDENDYLYKIKKFFKLTK
ncbi:MAG: NifU family protein [Fusobacteria bacterium]|nr:NifU family protein [Fusobacteriota bacterium]